MASKPKKIVNIATQEQQSWSDGSRTRKVSEGGFSTELGVSLASAVNVPEYTPIVLVNNTAGWLYVKKATTTADAAAPSGATDANIGVPPNSLIVWNSGKATRAGDLVSIRANGAIIAYVAIEDEE
jgi:hypothetical protein